MEYMNRSCHFQMEEKMNKKYESRDKVIFSPKTESQKGTRRGHLYQKYIYKYVYINPQNQYGDCAIT